MAIGLSSTISDEWSICSASWNQPGRNRPGGRLCGTASRGEAAGHDRGPRISHSPFSNLGAKVLSRPAGGGQCRAACTGKTPAFRESGGGHARSTGMMAGRDGSAVAGGPARHVPVLARPALELLRPRDGGIYIDGTFGAGGYTAAILDAADTQVIGIDRDQSA